MMGDTNVTKMLELSDMLEKVGDLSQKAALLYSQVQTAAESTIKISSNNSSSDFVLALTIFTLACFVGYYVVWKVTPALHTPLMSITNAISGIIIIGALIAAGGQQITFSSLLGLVAVFFASINIFGGFIVTERMLEMFKKKK